MRIKTQIKKELRKIERYELEHRSGFERAGALILTAVTLFSLTDLSHDQLKRAARTDVTLNRPITLNSSAEKNETVRMPVKMDEGIRATVAAGS